MLSTDNRFRPGAEGSVDLPHAGINAGISAGSPTQKAPLIEDITSLIDSGRNYVEAEVAFQKTRASVAASSGAKAAGAVVLALMVFNIALIALAVGLIMALQPLITIWGAIGVVVGTLLVVTLLLVRSAVSRGKAISAMFGDGDDR